MAYFCAHTETRNKNFKKNIFLLPKMRNKNVVRKTVRKKKKIFLCAKGNCMFLLPKLPLFYLF